MDEIQKKKVEKKKLTKPKRPTKSLLWHFFFFCKILVRNQHKNDGMFVFSTNSWETTHKNHEKMKTNAPVHPKSNFEKCKKMRNLRKYNHKGIKNIILS